MGISTISFSNVSRAQIMRVQAELRDALVESTSNRHADVGRTLGRLTGDAVSFRSQETSLDRLLQSNTLVAQRLTLMEDTLEGVARTADAFQAQLIAGLSNDSFLTSAKQTAGDALDQLTGALNLASGGQYLFAGTQTDVRPLNAWDAGPGAAVEAHFQTFLDAAGKTAATVSADEVSAYFGDGFVTGTPELDAGGNPVLDADGNAVMQRIAFDDLFADESWSQTFSNASDATIQSRISRSETISSSLSANERAFRDLVAGYAVASLVPETAGAGVRAAFADAARARMGAGTGGVTALRADLGNRQARVSAADESLTQQKDIVARSLAALEEVDLAEAANRVSALKTQLEASYRVTGLIQEINILDYL